MQMEKSEIDRGSQEASLRASEGRREPRALGPENSETASSNPRGRVSEQMVDLEELWEGSRLPVVFLGGEDGVAQPRVVAGQDLGQQRFVVEVRGFIHAQTAGSEG